ncbi:MAG: hypothetical protein NVSMB26_20320 [Beijerinckiaceae bacterium]
MINKHPARFCAGFIMSVAIVLSAPGWAQQSESEDAPVQERDQLVKPPGKAKKPAAKPAAAGKRQILVNNGHGTPLVILSVTPPGASGTETVVLLRDLAAKAKATAALPGKGCIFDVYGRFGDDSTIGFSKLDLCKDRSLNIVN